jgi:hypothetical protein
VVINLFLKIPFEKTILSGKFLSREDGRSMKKPQKYEASFKDFKTK